MEDRNSLLGQLANEAALERTSFLVDAARQMEGFLKTNAGRIKEIGGLVLIDDDPDYLSVAPDGTFRSRTRYLDEVTGEWVSDTELIESASELVELYNPAEVYAAFAEAAREAGGLPEEPTGAEELAEAAGLAPEERIGDEEVPNPYAGAADDWAAGRGSTPEPETPEDAARLLYDLALTFQERSQAAEARLVEQFQHASAPIAHVIGDLVVIDDEDERLTLRRSGALEAEVVPEDEEGRWKALTTPDDLVQFYDPTDVFGDLAEAIAEAYPEAAAENDGDDEEAGESDA
jgi:hypothetical protein